MIELGALLLNGENVVSKPSRKNVTLMEENERIDLISIRKFRKHVFKVRMQWPLSVCQGFAIAVATLEHKQMYSE